MQETFGWVRSRSEPINPSKTPTFSAVIAWFSDSASLEPSTQKGRLGNREPKVFLIGPNAELGVR